jgi:hypothetical protein
LRCAAFRKTMFLRSWVSKELRKAPGRERAHLVDQDPEDPH